MVGVKEDAASEAYREEEEEEEEEEDAAPAEDDWDSWHVEQHGEEQQVHDRGGRGTHHGPDDV